MATRADYKASVGADSVNELLTWLNLLDNQDWIPPAIKFLSRSDVTSEDLRVFLTDLERLAASILIRRVDITRRIERYGKVLEAIESGADHYGMPPLQLDAVEQAETLQRLRGEIYTVTRVFACSFCFASTRRSRREERATTTR